MGWGGTVRLAGRENGRGVGGAGDAPPKATLTKLPAGGMAIGWSLVLLRAPDGAPVSLV